MKLIKSKVIKIVSIFTLLFNEKANKKFIEQFSIRY